MTELVIDRLTWIRGTGGTDSGLLNKYGNKCCLGFLCLADGLTEDEIYGKIYPNHLRFTLNHQLMSEKHPIFSSLISGYNNSEFAFQAACINDATINVKYDNVFVTSKEHREKLLIELFAENGIILSFIN